VKEITTVLLEINNNNSVHFILCSLRCRLNSTDARNKCNTDTKGRKKSIKKEHVATGK
jgi:hypothetical protein